MPLVTTGREPLVQQIINRVQRGIGHAFKIRFAHFRQPSYYAFHDGGHGFPAARTADIRNPIFRRRRFKNTDTEPPRDCRFRYMHRIKRFQPLFGLFVK